MLTLEYEDDKVEEMYYINKEILEEDRKGEKNTFIMGEWKGVVEDSHTTWTGKGKSEVKCSSTFVKEMYLVITSTLFKKPKEDFTPSKYQKIENDITWLIYGEA
jgi:hypothetical protein